ncbi:unnamed protein product, partial [Brenthis ino]
MFFHFRFCFWFRKFYNRTLNGSGEKASGAADATAGGTARAVAGAARGRMTRASSVQARVLPIITESLPRILGGRGAR